MALNWGVLHREEAHWLSSVIGGGNCLLSDGPGFMSSILKPSAVKERSPRDIYRVEWFLENVLTFTNIAAPLTTWPGSDERSQTQVPSVVSSQMVTRVLTIN